MSNALPPRLPAAEFQSRMRRVEAVMERERLEALIGYPVGNQAGPRS